MSTRKERYEKNIACIDSYIKHQMTKRTEAERQAFRVKQIAMYDDKLERYTERLKNALSKSFVQKSKGE